MASVARASYSSVVEVLRPSKGAAFNGAPNFTWTNPKLMFDDDWGIPGQMLCNITLGWVRPGSLAPPAFEAGVPMPRIGTLFFDVTYEGKILLTAGDRVKCLSGPIEGTFELRVIPEPAKDFIGILDHAEVQIVETTILGKNIFPGTEIM